jgi:hypothetical protein
MGVGRSLVAIGRIAERRSFLKQGLALTVEFGQVSNQFEHAPQQQTYAHQYTDDNTHRRLRNGLWAHVGTLQQIDIAIKRRLTGVRKALNVVSDECQ